MAQYIRPILFTTSTGWTGAATDIDEVTASDTDFVYSEDNPNAGLNIELTNSGIADPEIGTGHIVRWRKALIDGGVVASSSGTGCDLDVELWQGGVDTGTLIASIRVDDPLGNDLSWTADSYTLTEAQANAITDYNDLHFHFHAKGGGGSPNNRRGAGISWLEIEIPSLGATSAVNTATTTSGVLSGKNYITVKGLQTFYFNGSDATAIDPDNSWTYDKNIHDGRIDTYAYVSKFGSITSNEIKVEGTNAPSSGDTILSVKGRTFANFDPTTKWTDYSTAFTTPTGGWTWAKLQALELICHLDYSTSWVVNSRVYTDNLGEYLGNARDIYLTLANEYGEVYRVELQVEVDSSKLFTKTELYGTLVDANAIPPTTINTTTTTSGTLFGSEQALISGSSDPFGVSTYYFDGSDATVTDNDNVWTNEANAEDGSISTFASTTTDGTNSTNELFIEGTNAPSSSGSITQVESRMYYQIGTLGEQWDTYFTLTTPTGGWTWSKIQALEVAIWRYSVVPSGISYEIFTDNRGESLGERNGTMDFNPEVKIYRLEIRVNSSFVFASGTLTEAEDPNALPPSSINTATTTSGTLTEIFTISGSTDALYADATYYFDGSQGVFDYDDAYVDVNNIVDGDKSTYGYSANDTANLNDLKIVGTNAPILNYALQQKEVFIVLYYYDKYDGLTGNRFYVQSPTEGWVNETLQKLEINFENFVDYKYGTNFSFTVQYESQILCNKEWIEYDVTARPRIYHIDVEVVSANYTEYYYDGNVSVTNENNSWINPANAYDGSEGTYAYTSDSVRSLIIVGTTYPSTNIENRFVQRIRYLFSTDVETTPQWGEYLYLTTYKGWPTNDLKLFELDIYKFGSSCDVRIRFDGSQIGYSSQAIGTFTELRIHKITVDVVEVPDLVKGVLINQGSMLASAWGDTDTSGLLLNFEIGTLSGDTDTPKVTDVYYFDNSVGGLIDVDSVWTDEQNIIDNNYNTFGFTSTSGSSSTNYISIKGTSAPSTGVAFQAVVFEIKIEGDILVYNLETPSGGWTYDKIQKLEIELYWVIDASYGNHFIVTVYTENKAEALLSSKWINSDNGKVYNLKLRTFSGQWKNFYIDGSVSASDGSGNWTNIANAYDGFSLTYATLLESAGSSFNFDIKGTTFPTSYSNRVYILQGKVLSSTDNLTRAYTSGPLEYYGTGYTTSELSNLEVAVSRYSIYKRFSVAYYINTNDPINSINSQTDASVSEFRLHKIEVDYLDQSDLNSGTLTGIEIANISGSADVTFGGTIEQNDYNSTENFVAFSIGQYYPSFSGKIKSISMILSKTGSPDADIRMKLYNVSGGLPTTLLENSNNLIACTSLTATATEYTWNFDSVQYDQDIAFALQVESSSTYDPSNCAILHYETPSVVDGNFVGYTIAWTSAASWDCAYKITLDGGNSGTLTAAASGGILGTINTATTTTSVLSADGLLASAVNTATTISSNLTVRPNDLIQGVSNCSSQNRVVEQLVGGNVYQMDIDYTGFGQNLGVVTGRIKSIKVLIQKFGNPDFDLVLGIFTVDGNGLPLAYQEESNNAISVENLSTSLQWVEFEMPGGIFYDNVELCFINGYNNIVTKNATNQIDVSYSATSQVDGFGIGIVVANYYDLDPNDFTYVITYQQTAVLLAKKAISSTVNTATTTVSVISGNGSLASTINTATTTTSDLTNGVTISPIVGEVNGIATINAVLTANGSLIGISNPALTISGEIKARGDVAIVINGVTTIIGILIANGTLAGASTNTTTTSGLLNSNLQGSVVVDTTTTTQAVLTANGILLGASTTATTITASLTSTLDAESSVNGQTTTSSVLSATGSLSHTSTSTTTTQGILSAEGTFAGTITTATTTSSELIAKGALTGSADGSCLNISLVSGLAELNASITTQTTTSGELQGGTSSNGVANGIATTSGILTALGSLESTSNGVATLSGLLNSNLQGSVVVDTTTTTVAVLTGYGALETTITSTTTTTGLLNSELSAEGSINGQATTVGTLVAIGQLQGASNGVSTISATLLANGELNAVLNGLATTSGLLNSNLKGSAVSDTGSVVTGTMIAEGSLQVSTDGSTTTNALIIGIAAISCTVNCTSTTSGTLNANGTLIGVSTTATTLAGVLNALGQLQGIINGITTTEARAISDAAVGIITAQATTSAQIIGKGGLSAIIDGDTSTSATLIGLGVSEGTANGQATTAGTLSAKGTLSGAINAIASASGTLITDAMLAVSNGQATINATLTQIISIEATSNGQATLQGQLVSDSLMFGSCLGLSDNSGQLTGLGNLESSISGLTTIDTALNAKGNLVVAISASATIQGILIATGNIEGQSDGVTTVQAITESNGLLNSVSNGQTTISGSLISTGLLVSDSNGVSTTSASLTAIGALVGNINSATTITTTLLAISSISGSIDGSASTSGILVSDALAGITNGTATTQSILTAYGSLAGAIEGTSDNELNPRVERTIEIQGSFEAKATTQGRLRVYDTNIDTTLFYEVVYLDRKYTVVYRKILHQVLYKNIIYYVRYKLTKRK